MGAMSRNKGARGEREVCEAYREYGFEAERTPLSGALSWMKGDVTTSLPDIHIEVKRTERLAVWDALMQAESDARDGQEPVLHFRRNHSGWYVCISLDFFLRLMRLSR